MIHSFFIRKVCRGNVSDAFKGQFVLPISALRGSEENKKKPALSTQQRWLHFPLPLVTFLHVNYSSSLPLRGRGAVFLEKEERRSTLQTFPAHSLDHVMGRFHRHENGGCDLCPLLGGPAAFERCGDTARYRLTPLLSEDRSAQVCA